MSARSKWRISRDDITARLVLLPTVLVSLVFVYGFIAFTIYLSFTNSKMLPVFDWVGLKNWARLFRLDQWYVALKNMGIFSFCTSGSARFWGCSSPY